MKRRDVLLLMGGIVSPFELPVREPTMAELVMNVSTAKALGLSLPPALLIRADEVLQ